MSFRLTVSEAKTEIMCLRTRGMLAPPSIFTVEAVGQAYKEAHDFVYLRGNANHDADLFIEVDRCIYNAWCSFRK